MRTIVEGARQHQYRVSHTHESARYAGRHVRPRERAALTACLPPAVRRPPARWRRAGTALRRRRRIHYVVTITCRLGDYFVRSFTIAIACLVVCVVGTIRANNELTHTFNNVKVIVYYENECNSGYRSATHTTWLLLVISKALSDLLFHGNQNVTV